MMNIMSPVTGISNDISKASDPVFSQKMLGDGVVIQPFEDVVCSPMDGEVVMVYETLHAIGIRNNDVEILLHIGVDTVELKGECFQAMISVGDKVKVQQPLVVYDFKRIKQKGYDESIMLIITSNVSDRTIIKKEGLWNKGEVIIEL